jgi:hypothetical protein
MTQVFYILTNTSASSHTTEREGTSALTISDGKHTFSATIHRVQYKPAPPPSAPVVVVAAAKLAHFSGVESHDIDPAFATGTNSAHPPLPAAAVPVPTMPALQVLTPRTATPARPQTLVLPLCVVSPALEQHSPKIIVNVRVCTPVRLWGGGVHETDDMRDVITRLRPLHVS